MASNWCGRRRFHLSPGGDEFEATYDLQVQVSARDEGESEDVVKEQVVPLVVKTGTLPLAPHLMSVVFESESGPGLPSFIEGEERRFTISGKLAPGVAAKTQIKIVELPDGAVHNKLDEQGNQFEVVWIPPLNTVTGEGEFDTSRKIVVEMVAEGDDGRCDPSERAAI